MAVFVLDKSGKPLMPCSEKRARLLLARGRARVHRQMPFVIRLVDRVQAESELQPVSIKIDPGSQFTGLALVRHRQQVVHVLSLMELVHRGFLIKKALLQRAGYRRRRRSANLRYREPRFNNRTRKAGWLPPSLQHRVDTTMSWVQRLRRWAPVSDLAVERVKFDLQKLQNPEISGIEYQQGELQGYEVREYLLEKWGRKCMYCQVENKPLQVEHIVARINGGSDRASNLGLACGPCNQKKDKLAIEVFLKKKPELLKQILAKAKTPLRDAAAVNATRNALFSALLATGLPVEAGTGGQTKFNRITHGIPKTHALDAACVGTVAEVHGWASPTLAIKAMGRGAYQRTRVCASGFPRGRLTRQKVHFGFQTGDMVKALVTKGKKVGAYKGRVAVRATGFFNIQSGSSVIQGISHKFCAVVQRADGYGYAQNPTAEQEHGKAKALSRCA
ncbi:RNA-guided endonuclease IscB [Geopseudomonas aromaticivorans]